MQDSPVSPLAIRGMTETMLSYLQKFNELPTDIKAKINTPGIMARVSELGGEYGANLASTVMKVMVKEIKLEALGAYLINDLGLSAEQARLLEQKLRRDVFASVIDYLLGASAGPKLVFAEADEKEAKQAAKPVATADFDAVVDGYVEEIVKQSRINFSDPLSAGKFRQVMKTYLRGTRDKLAVAETLTKAAELGGIALSRDTADRILLIAANYLNRRPAPVVVAPKIPVSEEKLIAPLPPAAEYDLEASLKDQGKLVKEASPVRFSAPLDTSHELAPPVPAVVPPVPLTRPEPRKAETRKAVKAAIAGQPIDKESFRRLTPAPVVDNTVKLGSGKVRMDDIRFASQAMSPIEELRSFALVNFRRLDPDPLKAIEKIKAKMELLGNEEYAKKIEAIAAWHESPLNRLYLAVCRRSLDENLALGAILDRERKKDKNFLRPEELSAIISLNRSLKF